MRACGDGGQAWDTSDALPITVSGSFNSRLFVSAPTDIVGILTKQDVTANFHRHCVTKQVWNHNRSEYYDITGRDSSVGVATGYGWTAEGSVFDSWDRKEIFLSSGAFRQALGPTQPPIQWVPGALSLAVNRPGREAHHSPPSNAEIKNIPWFTLQKYTMTCNVNKAYLCPRLAMRNMGAQAVTLVTCIPKVTGSNPSRGHWLTWPRFSWWFVWSPWGKFWDSIFN
jgi:hypothetical protein